MLLWTDPRVATMTGQPPKFPGAERRYLVEAIRYVTDVSWTDEPAGLEQDIVAIQPDVWVVTRDEASPAHEAYCEAQGIEFLVVPEQRLQGFPALSSGPGPEGDRRVIVTGCYDWLHSGHVRFFEEVSEYGDLYVVVGNDANVALLKGEGHPLFRQDHRRYMVQSIRYVRRALIASGMGWMDAIEEIAQVKPHIYAVNEDGDKPEKRAFCADGLEYVVLKRRPKDGLVRRTSTDLRGF